MRANVGVVAALLLAACGGSDGGGDPGPEPLNPAFGGTWSGTVVLSFQSGTFEPYPGTLAITVSGNTATVSLVCPITAAGSLEAHGSGNSVSWDGTLVCPPLVFPTICDYVVLTYRHATATLSGGTLTAIATGNGTGCGRTESMTVTFLGTK